MTQLNNPTISSLIEEDQGERGEYLKSPTPENWLKVTERDKVRRARVIELMQQDAMQTADDFFHASIMMLHGSTTEEYVLGHVFAVAAIAKGHPDAPWLSTRTLDNIMLSLGQGQVFDSESTEEADGKREYEKATKTVFLSESIKKVFEITKTDDETRENSA